jgi:hypothetical protein
MEYPWISSLISGMKYGMKYMGYTWINHEVGSPSSHDLASDIGRCVSPWGDPVVTPNMGLRGLKIGDPRCTGNSWKFLKCRSSMISWWFNTLQRWPFFHRRTDDSRRSASPSFNSNVNPGSIALWNVRSIHIYSHGVLNIVIILFMACRWYTAGTCPMVNILSRRQL